MLKNRFLRGLACFVLIGATAALYFGANAFSKNSVVSGSAEQADEGTASADASDTAQQEEGWDRPETEPSEEDLYGRLQVGDFEVLQGTDADTVSALEEAFAKERGHSVYSVADVNADGTDELIWQILRENKTDARVLAVFSDRLRESAELLMWNPDENLNEYYLLGTDSLLYIRQNEWYISEFHVTRVLFSLTGEEYAGDGISLYLVEDEAAYQEHVDPALQKRMSFITGAGAWYQRVPTGKTVEDAPVISKQEYDELFVQMTGVTIADISPKMAVKRQMSGTYVTGEADIYKRVRYNTPAFDVRVTYPHLMNGDKAETINRALSSRAYSLVFEEDASPAPTEGDNPPADGAAGAIESPETRLQAMQNDLSCSLTAEIVYLMLDEDEEYVSTLFVKKADADEMRLVLATFNRASGRQMQLGDVATAADVENAIQRGQCVVMRWEEAHLVRDVALSEDKAFQATEFAATCSGDATWKNIGVDEQYIYIVLHANSADEMLLRVPMWTIGVSSAGHMQLLTMHGAYPFMETILDTATQVRVRKSRGGFEIGYVSAAGSQVMMHQRGDDNPPRHDMTATESRDYFSDMYEEGMTAYQTGCLQRIRDSADTEGVEEPESDGQTLNYFAIEEGFGAAGHVFFEVDKETYRLDYSGRMSQGFPVLTTDTVWKSLTYAPAGLMTKDSLNYEQWTDLTDDTRRLVYMVAEDNGEEEPLLYVFKFNTQTRTDETGLDKEMTVLSVSPKDNPWRETLFELDTDVQTVLFRDLNLDGYPDFTIGTVREEDHTDERNFLYNPQTGAYIRGPAVLETSNTYRVYREAGFVIVTDRAYTAGTRLVRYKWNTIGAAAGTLEQVSTLTLTPQANGRLLVRMTDDTKMQEESPVVLDLELAFEGELPPLTDPRLVSGDECSTVMGFFLSNTIWESSMDGIPAEGSRQNDTGDDQEKESTSVRLLMAENITENPVETAGQTYLYLLAQDGDRLERIAVGQAQTVNRVETVGADYAGQFYWQEEKQAEATAQDNEPLATQSILVFLAFENEDGETGIPETEGEPEPDVRMDVPELMRELGFVE